MGAADAVRHTVFATIRDAVFAPDAAPWCAWDPEHPGAVAARSQADTPVTVTGSWCDLGGLADALAALPAEFAAAEQHVDRVPLNAAAIAARPSRNPSDPRRDGAAGTLTR